MTMGVYQALLQKALGLPLDLLADIVRAGQEISWGGDKMFAEALRQRSQERVAARQAAGGASGPIFGGGAAVDDNRPLQRKSAQTALDLDELAALLEHAGPFSRHFPNYEYRAEQVQMLRAVARAFSEGRHLIVEAGTGTGKSVGYLIPAAMWAKQNGERVVISTNTLNLQDQLVRKDIPDLQVALDLDFKVAVLKGRSHYLCPRRLETLRRHGPKTADEMKLLAKVLVWLHETQGQTDAAGLPLQEISMGPHEQAVWLRVSAEDEGCTSEMCQSKMHGVCPFYRARKAAQAAHVVIVNHALLLADIAAENRVIPEYKYLVIDEAHHLEAATTDGLSFEVNRPDLERRLRDLGGPNAGLFAARWPPIPAPRCRPTSMPAWITKSTAPTRLPPRPGRCRRFFEGVAHLWKSSATLSRWANTPSRCASSRPRAASLLGAGGVWSGTTCGGAGAAGGDRAAAGRRADRAGTSTSSRSATICSRPTSAASRHLAELSPARRPGGQARTAHDLLGRGSPRSRPGQPARRAAACRPAGPKAPVAG